MSATYEHLVALRDERRPANTQMVDGRYFVDLLIPVAYGDNRHIDGDGIVYTCRELDQETLRCNAYGARPRICSEYPYGRACEWCTFDPTNPTAPVQLRATQELCAQRSPHALESGIFDPDLVDVLVAVAASDHSLRQSAA